MNTQPAARFSDETPVQPGKEPGKDEGQPNQPDRDPARPLPGSDGIPGPGDTDEIGKQNPDDGGIR